ELMINQLSDVIELPNKFKNLQNEFKKEKDKNAKLEKEMNEKIQKIKSVHENEIKELKQNIQNLIDEKIKEKSFVQIKNKWKYIDEDYNCCDNKCINTNTPFGVCFRGNGFINLINNENIKYIKCEDKEGENNSNKRNEMNFGLRSNKYEIVLDLWHPLIIYRKHIDMQFDLPTSFTFNYGDVFGCGLIYPPTNKMAEHFPYVFFTQNGVKIGKALLLKDGNDEFYRPFIYVECCSVETNFGNNLENKRFCYDITKHSVLQEFYDDSDGF
uniref:SPRY domain-containing protein n=1 Tax=Meloidogyne hapla TaxID=6305 RepID=A0A1I8C2H0_MELHA